MKKVLIAMALLIGLTSFAQRGGHHEQRKGEMHDMTPEQMATLKTKRMALALDLNENQLDQVMQINLKDIAFRKSKLEERKAKKESGELTKLSGDERFALENERLDRKLALQQQLKEILTEEQYVQWKKINHRKHMGIKRKMQHKSRKG